MKKYLVIGNPIKHSLSPKLHNYWFKKYNLSNHNYDKRKVTEDDLKKVILEIKNDKLAGLNITVPFKRSIIPFCDILDKTAEDLRSVNTISKKNGKIIGWNTDSLGFLDCLKASNIMDEKKSVFILGAGGVTSAVLDALWGFGSKQIYLSNRTKDKAIELKNMFKDKFDKIEILNWEEKPKKKCGIVINTTSMGLAKNDLINIDFNEYENKKSNQEKSIFIDLIYSQKTNFLKAAEKRGNLAIDGKIMFLGQAKYSFNIWTNILPKIDTNTLELFKND